MRASNKEHAISSLEGFHIYLCTVSAHFFSFEDYRTSTRGGNIYAVSTPPHT